jgi:hypothetical protein
MLTKQNTFLSSVLKAIYPDVISCGIGLHNELPATLTEIHGWGYNRLAINKLHNLSTSEIISKLAFWRYLSLSDRWCLFFLRTHMRVCV